MWCNVYPAGLAKKKKTTKKKGFFNVSVDIDILASFQMTNSSFPAPRIWKKKERERRALLTPFSSVSICYSWYNDGMKSIGSRHHFPKFFFFLRQQQPSFLYNIWYWKIIIMYFLFYLAFIISIDFGIMKAMQQEIFSYRLWNAQLSRYVRSSRF